MSTTPPEPLPTVGYVVSTWPRLSQTFVLNEIRTLERQGVPVRIFSTKHPGEEPVHGDVARVKAQVQYLSLRRQWRQALRANVRMAMSSPGRYVRGLCRAASYRRWGVFRRFWQAALLADLLRRHPVDHLHAHFATAPALLAMLAGDMARVPYSFTAHARDIYVDTQPRLLRDEMRRAATVVTISEYNRRYLNTLLGSSAGDRVRCIYNGVDLQEFSTHRQLRPGLPSVLTVARLVEKKGMHDLLTATHILLRRRVHVRVEIIGDGPLLPTLRAQVQRLGLSDHVVFRGSQPREAVRDAFGGATVFALPCIVADDGDRDGIPTVLLEAMACGVPVVSTHVSGIPELVHHGANGLLVSPGDPRGLADALYSLINNPQLCQRLTASARATLAERFSLDGNVATLRHAFVAGAAR